MMTNANLNTPMREGFEQQRKAGMNVDWFTWQIAWHDALFTQCDIAGDAAPSASIADTSMIGALRHIDEQLTEYLEGMPADETSRNLRDVARNALSSSGVADIEGARIRALQDAIWAECDGHKCFDDEAQRILSALDSVPRTSIESIADTAGAKPTNEQVEAAMDVLRQKFAVYLTPGSVREVLQAAIAATPAPSVADAPSGSTDDRTADEWKAKFFAEQRHRMELQAALDTVMPEVGNMALQKGEEWRIGEGAKLMDAYQAAGASEGQAFKEWFDENCPEFQRTSYSPADVEANAASLAKAAWHARDAELTALRERVAGMEKDSELGAYVRRLHGSLGRQTEALYDNIEHAIQEQKQ